MAVADRTADLLREFSGVLSPSDAAMLVRVLIRHGWTDEEIRRLRDDMARVQASR